MWLNISHRTKGHSKQSGEKKHGIGNRRFRGSQITEFIISLYG